MIDTCPACGSGELQDFFSLDDVPTNSCLLLEDRSEAEDFPRGRLDLAACQACGFITNRSFEPGLAEYSSRYEETQGFSPTFVAFARSLAGDWVKRHRLERAHVLEIGCGKGEFLTWMVESGAGCGTGIDPGVHPERLDSSVTERLTWIADLYDDRYLDLPADAIVCRHTLEHVSGVRDFVKRIRRHVGDRPIPVLFELPDTTRVLREVAFWDVYYEHCSYFTAGSLARLFRGNGFEILDASYGYDGQYLLLEARPSVGGVSPPTAEDDVAETVADAVAFSEGYERIVNRWQDRLTQVRDAGGRAVLWGGGSKAVAFLSVASLARDIDAVVDINPHKQGRFIAGAGHEVVAPDALKTLQPALVVVANPIYLSEVQASLAELAVQCDVETL